MQHINYSKNNKLSNSYNKAFNSNNNQRNNYMSPNNNSKVLSPFNHSKNNYKNPLNSSYNEKVSSSLNYHHRLRSDDNLKKYNDINFNAINSNKQNNNKKNDNSNKNYKFSRAICSHSVYISSVNLNNK